MKDLYTNNLDADIILFFSFSWSKIDKTTTPIIEIIIRVNVTIITTTAEMEVGIEIIVVILTVGITGIVGEVITVVTVVVVVEAAIDAMPMMILPAK